MKNRWNTLLAALSAAMTFSSLSHATALPVPLDGQKTSMWCWAASGQMIMNYLGATGVQQCKEANLELGRTDCCDVQTPAACVKGGHTQFTEYHFDYQTSPQMSFQAIQYEIDHGRPIEFAWNWDGGGGHVMVAIGYKIVGNVNYVTINNPIPVGMGATYDLTYAAWVSGAGYTHQVDYFNIADHPVCSSDFNGMPAGSFQACFDYQALHGRYPVTLSAYQTSGGIKMAGSFQPGSSRPVRTLMTSAQFQSYFNTYASQGYRPDQVTVVPTASGPLFTALWTPVDGAFTTQYGMTDAGFQTTFNQMASAGYLLADLYAYPDGVTRYVATWVKKASNGYYAYTNMTSADYSAHFNQLAALGFRPTRFNAFTTPAGIRYAAVWQKLSGGFYMFYAMTPSSYQSTYNTLSAQGYRLNELTGLDDVLAAVWTQ